MKKYIICFVGFLSLFLALSTQSIGADANTLDFEITPMLPENQRVKDINYFDLLLGKGASQTIHITIRNLTDEERTLAIEINPAMTNHHGVVEYVNQKTKEKRIPFDIQKSTSVKKKWSIKGKETIDIPIKVEMPKVSYEGIVAGGIRISDTTPDKQEARNTKESTEESTENLVIRNKYTYVIALLLSQEERAISPEIEMGAVSLKTLDNTDVIGIELANLANTYIQEVRTEASVKKEGAELAFSQERGNMKIAPSSTMVYPIPVTKDLPAGDYQAMVTVYSELVEEGQHQASDGNHYRYKWEFQEGFSLEEQIVKGNTGKNESASNKNNWIYLVLFVFLSGLFIGVGIGWQKKKRKKTTRKSVGWSN